MNTVQSSNTTVPQIRAAQGSAPAGSPCVSLGRSSMASDEEDYEVERILGERAGGAEFKVKWLGYPISEANGIDHNKHPLRFPYVSRF
eukprot:COSAG01_NODE_2043_length_8564_cov_76.365859_5_plen_88_part_00